MAARQARARGVQHVLAPVIDVARDPRWGRIEETYGEDPYLVSRMGVAAIRGFQGRRRPARRSTRSTCWRRPSTSPPTARPRADATGRPANYSAHVVREVFLPPFEAAVREAKVASVMAELQRGRRHPVARQPVAARRRAARRVEVPAASSSPTTSASPSSSASTTWSATSPRRRRAALEAGVDLECRDRRLRHAGRGREAGRISESRRSISAVARVLRAKFLLGLFEHPYVDPPTPGRRSAGGPRAGAPGGAARRSSCSRTTTAPCRSIQRA